MNKIILALLLIASTAPTASLALEEITDADLSLATAQDGLSVQFTTGAAVGQSGLSIGKLSWEDNVEPMPAGATQYATNDTRDKHQLDFNSVTFNNLDATLRLQSGSNGADTASNLSLDIQPFEMTAASMVVQGARVNATTTSIASNLGQFVADHNAVTSLNLDIKNGLFNVGANTFNLRVGLEDANYYVSKGTTGQLVIGDVTANIIAKGRLFVDATSGLTFQGDLDLYKSADASNPSEGIEFSLLHKGTAGLIGTADKARGIAKVGWFGKYTGVNISFRGTQELTTGTSVTTASEFGLIGGTTGNRSIIGKSGIAFSVTGMRAADANTGWLIGEAGVGGTTALNTTTNTGHSVVMTDSRPFSNVNNTTTRGVTDFGNIYLNLTNSKYMQMRNHTNNNLTKAPSFGVAGTPNNAKQAITPNLGYTVVNATNPTLNFFTQTNNKAEAARKEGLFIGLRGFDSQAVYAKTVFKENNVAPSNTPATAFQDWSLATLVHGVDANAHIFEYDADSIGFDYMVQTKGRGTNDQTTSLGLLDSSNMLFTGIINLDLFSAGSGYIDITTSNIRVNFNKMLLAFDFGVGGGIFLPGAPGQAGATVANYHTNPTNELFRVKGRLNAVNSSFTLANNTATDNRITLNYDLNLQKNVLGSNDVESGTPLANADLSFIHFIEGGDRTTGAFEGITGRVTGSASVNISNDRAGIALDATFNPADPFTIRNIGMYPQGDAAQFKDVAAFTIKSGTIRASFDIRPVNR